MKKILFLITLISFFGCINKQISINNTKTNFDAISFDVVEKDLINNVNLPKNTKLLLNKWFNEKIYVNGLEGKLTIKINDYDENIIDIDNGKKTSILLSFTIIIEKPSLSQKKIIEGNVSSYSELSGDFSLNDFENMIANTQSDLIIRLNNYLISKI